MDYDYISCFPKYFDVVLPHSKLSVANTRRFLLLAIWFKENLLVKYSPKNGSQQKRNEQDTTPKVLAILSWVRRTLRWCSTIPLFLPKWTLRAVWNVSGVVVEGSRLVLDFRRTPAILIWSYKKDWRSSKLDRFRSYFRQMWMWIVRVL